MTTIATDGQTMAGDGMCIRSDTIALLDAVKIERLPDGRIVGTSGGRKDGVNFRNWLTGAGEKPKIKDRWAALVLHPDGTATYYCESDLDGLPTELPSAIGSGQDYAFGAMDSGATPAQAVAAASLRDPYSGGTITVLDRKGS